MMSPLSLQLKGRRPSRAAADHHMPVTVFEIDDSNDVARLSAGSVRGQVLFASLSASFSGESSHAHTILRNRLHPLSHALPSSMSSAR